MKNELIEKAKSGEIDIRAQMPSRRRRINPKSGDDFISDIARGFESIYNLPKIRKIRQIKETL